MNLRKLFRKPAKRPYLFEKMGRHPAAKDNKFIFCTGMGRSGTHFLAKLAGLSSNVEAYHLDEMGNPIGDSFYQYARWYGLNVDTNPFFTPRLFLSEQASKSGKVFCESNPYLNLHVPDLLQQFDAKVIVLFRDPKKVIESHYNKGWYQGRNPQFSAGQFAAPGYDYSHEQAHYFFGRFYPKEEIAFKNWSNYSVVGKIAWMWSTVYKSLLEASVGQENCKIVNTENIDYPNYEKLATFLSIDPIDKPEFDDLLKRKPGKGTYTSRPEWNDTEVDEFNQLVNGVHNELVKSAWL